MTPEQKQIIERLLQFAKTDIEAATRALSPNASEFDINVALYMAHTLGIE